MTIDRPERQKSHKDYAREQVVGAIGQICDAWNDAHEAAWSRGYPSGGSGGSGGIGGHGDPTGNRAMIPDSAEDWIKRATSALVFVLRFSTNDTGARWTGSFNPVLMKRDLQRAGVELVEIWPRRIQSLLNRLYDLADQALREWPPTPHKGEVIGDVRVLERTRTGDDCAKCGRYVAGDASDPIRRLDGKPYHQQPCYEAMRKRKQRS